MSGQLRLENLSIDICDYGPEKGKYTGKARFKGQYGGIDIVLAPSVSQNILRLCADALVENSKAVAETLSAQVIEQADNLLPPAVAGLDNVL